MLDPAAVIPRTAPPEEALREALRTLDTGVAVAIATVVERRGSSPATPGQKLAIGLDEHGEAAALAVGTVGGGAVEQAVVRLMLDALRAPTTPPKVHTFRLGPSLGMCCGGSADILVEVMRAPLSVVLVGAGHVGLATAIILRDLGFAVVLADARDSAVAEERTAVARARGVRVIHAEHDDPGVLGGAASASALVVMTHDHQLDQRVIEWGLRRRFAFVGGVGSRAKAERTRQRLEARGFDGDDIARVRMPVGLSIGARRPMEIAVAIAGELVAFRASRERLVRPVKDAGAANDGAPDDDAEEPALEGSTMSMGRAR